MPCRALHCWASQQWHPNWVFILLLLNGIALPAVAQVLPRDLESPLPAPLIPAPGRPGTPGGTAYDPNVANAVTAPGQYPGSLTNQSGWTTIGTPTAPGNSTRPATWPGGRAPQPPRRFQPAPGGESLAGSPLDRDSDPEEARLARARLRQQTRPLGGPPSPQPTTISRPIVDVLASEYDLGGRDLAPAEHAAPSELFGSADQGVAQAQYVEAAGAPPLILGPSAGQTSIESGPPAGPRMARSQAPRPTIAPPPKRTARFDDSARHAATAASPDVLFLLAEPDDEIGPTTILARVDQQVIIGGDVLPDVNAKLIKNAKQIRKGQVKQLRRMLVQQRLAELIQTRLAYADAMREIPDKARERIDTIMSEMFEKEALPQMLNVAKVENRAELDAALRRTGSTLDIEKRVWIEGEMAKQWVGQHLKFDAEITHQEMLDYYHRNLTEYEVKAAILWEELKVSYRGAASRAQAWQRLATAGNQVLAGRPLADVARDVSDGATASEGGRRDWTNLGSLVNKQLEDTLFQLPINQLSPILDDEKALYIVRVLERRQAGTVPFTEAQSAIREKIRDQHLQKQMKKFLDELKAKYRVWTIFDGTPDPVTGMLPPESLRQMAPLQASGN
ncbi:MAG: peptidyl-prolyl cis-trans isomerase [Pirellulales bacterium]|nr:peptidyl-prolyl cis-trans isomerase [Pirellulales bacterium]